MHVAKRAASPFGHTAILIGIILLGAVLRLVALGHQSLWGDEINVAVAATGSIGEVLEGARSHVSAPPLDYVVVHYLSILLGRSEFALRLGAAAWGILSIPLIYLLGERIAGRPVGLLAALLLATSPLHIAYSRESKFYAALVFFALLSNVAFLRAVRRNGRRDWLLHCLSGSVGVYFHPFVAVVIGCQGAYLLLGWLREYARGCRRRASVPSELARYLLSAGLTAICLVPWLVWDIAQQKPVGEFHTAFDFTLLLNSLLAFGLKSRWPALLLVVLVACGAVIGPRRLRARFVGLLVLDLLAVGLVVLLDNLQSYWFDPKQALFALPAYLTLAALGLAALYDWAAGLSTKLGLARMAAPVLMILAAGALALLGTSSAVKAWGREQQDWRGVGAYLAQNVRGGDLVVQTWLLQPNSLGWYFRASDRNVVAMKADGLRLGPLDKLNVKGDVWWVLVHSGRKEWLRKQVGEEFDIVSFAWLAVLHKEGVTSAEEALDATVTLLELQGELSPAESNRYLSLAHNLLRAGQADMAGFYMERGNRQLADGDWQAAAASFERALVCRPDWAMALTKLGNAYRSLGQTSEAEASYLRSIEVDPRYVGAYINLGGIREIQGQGEAALELYQEALEVAPDSPWANSVLGSLLLKLGDPQQGFMHLQRAVEMEPANVIWLLALADGYRQRDMDSQAASIYKQILALDPGNRRATEALRLLRP